MANGTYNNPRAGSNGSKSRMKNLTDKVNKQPEDPVTPKSGEFQNLSNSKKISQKKFERKLKRAKQGEVFKASIYDPATRPKYLSGLHPTNITQTYTKKGKKTFIKRESSTNWQPSYLKVKK